MGDLYKSSEQKKLHDLLPALCAIDPSLTGCTFRQAKLEWARGGNKSSGDRKGSKNAAHKKDPTKDPYDNTNKSGERVFPSPIGRWKNGGEWGCVGGVGKWIDFSDAKSFANKSGEDSDSLKTASLSED